MDTKKQRQRRRDDVRLTESGDTRSEQLLMMPTELLTNREWLPGSECHTPGWFLDIKYQFLDNGLFHVSTYCTMGLKSDLHSFNFYPGLPHISTTLDR